MYPVELKPQSADREIPRKPGKPDREDLVNVVVEAKRSLAGGGLGGRLEAARSS